MEVEAEVLGSLMLSTASSGVYFQQQHCDVTENDSGRVEVEDANIGSIFGIGYAPWTGGAIQFINQYGVRAFTERASALAETYGERFAPPKLLQEKAETNTPFA